MSTNNTDDCAAAVLTKHPSANLYVYPTMALGIAIMTLNTLVVVAVIKNKRLHKPAFYYVCSLAVADFIAALTLLYSFLRNSLNHEQVVMNEIEVEQGIFVASISASILSLLAISLNRYFVILHPFHYRSRMNNTIVIVAIIIIWVYSMILGALPIAGWNAKYGDCSSIFPGLARTYVFVLSLHVIVVLMVILGLYTAIFLKVRQSANFIRAAHNKDQKAHIKVAKTLFIVTAAFAICWLPIMTVGILDMAKSITLAKYIPFFTVLAVCNSLLNPIIYACREPEMRKTFTSILCPSACCRRRERHREPISDDSTTSFTWLTACFVRAPMEVPYEREDHNVGVPRGRGNEAKGGFDEARGGIDEARGGGNEVRGGGKEVRGGGNEARAAGNEARGFEEKPFIQQNVDNQAHS